MIQLCGYDEALSIKGGNGRESGALLEAHVMDEILHRIRWVDGFEAKSVNGWPRERRTQNWLLLHMTCRAVEHIVQSGDDDQIIRQDCQQLSTYSQGAATHVVLVKLVEQPSRHRFGRQLAAFE